MAPRTTARSGAIPVKFAPVSEPTAVASADADWIRSLRDAGHMRAVGESIEECGGCVSKARGP